MQSQPPPQSTSIKIPGNLRDRVQHLAKTRKRTPHALMLQAIEAYVDREEKRDAFRQEGVAAWEEYQRTGLHLTNDEVKTWLKELAAGNYMEPPACHI